MNHDVSSTSVAVAAGRFDDRAVRLVRRPGQLDCGVRWFWLDAAGGGHQAGALHSALPQHQVSGTTLRWFGGRAKSPMSPISTNRVVHLDCRTFCSDYSLMRCTHSCDCSIAACPVTVTIKFCFSTWTKNRKSRRPWPSTTARAFMTCRCV